MIALIAKNYFVIGIILLMLGSAVSVWGITAYFDLKKVQKEYRELPHDVRPGSSVPYSTEDGFFWARNGMIITLFSTAATLLIKWKVSRTKKE